MSHSLQIKSQLAQCNQFVSPSNISNKASQVMKTVQKQKFLLIFLIYTILMPNVFAQEDHDHDHDHEHEEEHEEEDSGRDFSKSEGWAYGLLASFGIGLIGVICTIVVILVKKYTKFDFKPVIKVLVAFAVGALCGDAFIHLIPLGFGAHNHESEEDHANETEEEHEEHSEESEESEANPKILSLMLIIGMSTFFIIEKLLVYFGIGHTHGGELHKAHDDDHQCLNEQQQLSKRVLPQTQGSNNELNTVTNLDVQQKPFSQQDAAIKQPKADIEVQVMQVATQNNNNKSENSQENKAVENLQKQTSIDSVESTKGWRGKKPEGWLNLIGDLLHNILDGIAIGAIFSTGDTSSCVSTFVAIVAHEIPQEIGDVGILLHSRFTNMQALICNGSINFSALIGTIIGLALGELGDKTDAYLNLFIAGNFLYIGLVDMLPTIREEKSLKMLSLQILFMGLGFFLMYVVLWIEEATEGDDHDH